MSQTLAAPAVMPSRELSRPLKECANLNEAFRSGEFRERIGQALPRHLNPDAMLRVFIQATSKAPKILECDLRQSIGAFLTLSQMGLAPNNPLGEAFLIPFGKNKFNRATKKWEPNGYDLNVVIGYKGYLALAFRSGMVGAVHADVVWPGDEFDYNYGTDQFLKHRPKGLQPDGAAPLYAYAVAHLKDNAGGVPPFRVLPWADILRARNGSQAYQQALRAKEEAESKGWKIPGTYTEAPWVKWTVPMAMKTAWNRLATWVPRSLEMVNAQIIDEAADRGARVDFSAALEGQTISQDTLQVDEPTPEADTAFSLRDESEAPQQENRVEQLRPRQEQQPQPAQEQQPRKPMTYAPQAPHFDAYLVNEDGELADDYGRGGHFTDAVLWAEALVKLASRPGMKDRVIEANRDDMAEAGLIPAAAEVLRDLTGATEDISDTKPHNLFVEVPTKAGKPYWPAYVPAVRARLETVASLDEIVAFEVHNVSTFDTLPPATKRGVEVEINMRRAALAPAEQEQTSDAPAEPQQEASAPDPDVQTADSLIADIRAAKSHTDFRLLQDNGAIRARMNGLRARNPEQADRVKAAAAEREAEILAQLRGDGGR